MKPSSPSLTLPGARIAWLSGLGALASRLYVYLSGFLAIFLMAAAISPARFGEYSIYQSVLEVALVLGTLGSSLLFSRNAAPVQPGTAARVTRGDVVRTLAIGLPLATVLVTYMVVGWQLAGHPPSTRPSVVGVTDYIRRRGRRDQLGSEWARWVPVGSTWKVKPFGVRHSMVLASIRRTFQPRAWVLTRWLKRRRGARLSTLV